MTTIVGALLKQFGPTSGAAVGPTTPTFTLTDNGDGTVTVAISSSSVGSVNIVYTQAVGEIVWTNSGNRVGNGSVTLNLDDGRYFVYVQSTLNSQSVVTPAQTLIVNSGSESGLTHSPADIVRYLLVDVAQGTLPEDESAWPIFADSEPDEPDECITVYDTSGIVEGRAHKTGEVQEHYGIQVRLRCLTPESGYARMRTLMLVMDELIRLDHVSIVNSEYLVTAISRKGGILSLGEETPNSKRYVFTLNAIVSLKQLH